MSIKGTLRRFFSRIFEDFLPKLITAFFLGLVGVIFVYLISSIFIENSGWGGFVSLLDSVFRDLKFAIESLVLLVFMSLMYLPLVSSDWKSFWKPLWGKFGRKGRV